MEKNKSISFVMPCHNDGKFIEAAVRSIRDQDLPDIEMIVVNDGSTDNSKSVCESLKEEGLIDKFIDLEKNQGACVARNIGAKEASGKYLSFLPADAILYPGMARIWYNTLEDNPDYDFVYGGYRFVDESWEPIAGYDLFFQPFDPYLLEVTNYIDGSFPIRTSAFWKYAKKMNQPDGLWDKNIKSLQDWDFWLSVVKNGGKGFYIQDIFFGTQYPHPGGLSFDSNQHWLERTEDIKKKHGIPIRKLCVASLGAGWHGKRIAYLLGADFKEMPSFKPHRYDALYVIGFYPEFAAQHDAMFFNNVQDPKQGRTAAKKIVHFVGSDIWQLYNCSLLSLRFWREYFAKNVDVLLCEADFTQKELKELGIENVQIVPIPPAKLYEVRPLPKKFTVACYMPGVNRDFYNPNEMIEVVKKMPDVEFKFYGNQGQVGKDPALPQNLTYVGYVENMEPFISECTAIMRFPKHDGLPLGVLEFLLAGRYSTQSVPIKYTNYLANANIDDIVASIRNLQKQAEEGVNKEASNYWRKELNHDLFKERIKFFAEYDPKQYWEKRAADWTQQAEAMDKAGQVEYDEIKKVLDEVPHKSLLDLGCGDARWYPKLKEWGVENYWGIDISEKLIKAAEVRFPHLKDHLLPIKIEDIPGKLDMADFDVVFAYTALEHIKEEDFKWAVKAIKALGKKIILVEPENFISRNYCFSHDYRKHFNVVKEVKLTNKTIFLCNP